MKNIDRRCGENSDRTQGQVAGGVRPRLLFLCQTLPYPPDGGVHIRAFHLLRILSQQYDVAALCFFRRATRPTPEAVEQALEGLRLRAGVQLAEAFPIPQEQSRARLLWDHGRSVLAARAYTVFTHESVPFRRRLAQLRNHEEFDLIHFDSLDLSYYLKDLPAIPVVCDHHNVESVLLERRAQQEPTAFRRRYIALQARLTQREEQRWCPRVALNLTVSSEDRELLLARAPGASVVVVPNGVDTSDFEPAFGGWDGIVFVGGYTWFPNRDGMQYFAERVLPLVRKRCPETSVRWVGRAPSHVMQTFRKDFGIEMTGFVPDIRPHVNPAACFIVPLRVGGGTRLKILDAWAMGKAVVSTSQGCEGLQAIDGENILIRDSAQGFADAVHQVLTQPRLRLRLGEAGRVTAEAQYDWEKIGARMLLSYSNLRAPDLAR
jgi:polysaccharide biosynthesis protein PslH